MARVVLSRELSRDAIEHICLNSPIEIETFVHGALCMCYSGQCFFSSVIGGRSGNRGLCAQPCRLKYGWGERADANPLSLKDMSLAGHIQELKKLGVKCLKIEGRMKRPEYVSVVTGIYARAIRESREPTPEELAQLEAAFSRQGFTDGYYLDRKGPEMFGVREEGQEPRELFAQARTQYQSGERQCVGVVFYAMIRPGEPVQVGVQDEVGHTVTASGPAGLKQLRGDAVILTMGCRERTRGALAIPGSRPAGIYTAGVAQEYINLRNLMVGREVVILGSGDIGMIMARRMTLEGAHVKAVYEVQPYPSGLPRNIE